MQGNGVEGLIFRANRVGYLVYMTVVTSELLIARMLPQRTKSWSSRTKPKDHNETSNSQAINSTTPDQASTQVSKSLGLF